MRTLVAVFAVTLAACSSSYHPEYHPVTVSNFSQNIAYPVSVVGGATIERPPVYVVPAAPSPVLAAPVAPEAPPADFFK